jgi:hypothetical protein
MLIGYARVSTVDQNLTLQRDALTEAGCAKTGSAPIPAIRGIAPEPQGSTMRGPSLTLVSEWRRPVGGAAPRRREERREAALEHLLTMVP